VQQGRQPAGDVRVWCLREAAVIARAGYVVNL
jgi:hypothetical protein